MHCALWWHGILQVGGAVNWAMPGMPRYAILPYMALYSLYYIIHRFNAPSEPIWYDTLFMFIVSYHMIHCNVTMWRREIFCQRIIEGPGADKGVFFSQFRFLFFLGEEAISEFWSQRVVLTISFWFHSTVYSEASSTSMDHSQRCDNRKIIASFVVVIEMFILYFTISQSKSAFEIRFMVISIPLRLFNFLFLLPSRILIIMCSTNIFTSQTKKTLITICTLISSNPGSLSPPHSYVWVRWKIVWTLDWNRKNALVWKEDSTPRFWVVC